ncbi:hypothetical protein evm_015070, partial [Chilo suppressalis]
MNVLCFLLYLSILLHVKGDLFDRYSGEKKENVKKIDKSETNRSCTIDVKPCLPFEGSRVDGTCNNYKYPGRGSARGPYLRLLKPDYSV